jgi:all-trans-retinol 13,14-reductase
MTETGTRALSDTFDYVVIGSGIGGLFTAALLANAGRSVCVLEKHYLTGGYAHSFHVDKYWFCAGLHYVFNCQDGEDGGIFLDRLGLRDDVKFAPMDESAFDRIVFPGLEYQVKAGIDRNIQELSGLFPGTRSALVRYYKLLQRFYEQAFQVPVTLPLSVFVRRAWPLRHLLLYRNYTTQRFFDQLKLPLELQDVLSGQCGNMGIPPETSSLIAHALNVMAYDQGASFPATSYHDLIRKVEGVIKRAPGCKLRLSTEVTRIDTEHGRAVGVTTAAGDQIRARNVLFNGDPSFLPSLLPADKLPSRYLRKLKYEYSPGSFTCYMGLKDVDLPKHGFGDWNIWHYPHHDMNAIYRRQLREGNLDQPFLAITTPTLHGVQGKKIAPPGKQQMVICTWASYDKAKKLREQGDAPYYEYKEHVTNAILDTVDKHYLPGIRQHIDVIQVGSPTTNEFYCAAPGGNSYGANMTPDHVNLGKLGFRTPLPNVHLINATSGMPGLGGGFRGALNLFADLTKDQALLKQMTRKRPIRHVQP